MKINDKIVKYIIVALAMFFVVLGSLLFIGELYNQTNKQNTPVDKYQESTFEELYNKKVYCNNDEPVLELFPRYETIKLKENVYSDYQGITVVSLCDQKTDTLVRVKIDYYRSCKIHGRDVINNIMSFDKPLKYRTQSVYNDYKINCSKDSTNDAPHVCYSLEYHKDGEWIKHSLGAKCIPIEFN